MSLGHCETQPARSSCRRRQKRWILGIQLVKQRLVSDSSGKPRVFFFRNFKNAYEWQPASEGRNAKEGPRKGNDHAMDALRETISPVLFAIFSSAPSKTSNSI